MEGVKWFGKSVPREKNNVAPSLMRTEVREAASNFDLHCELE